MGRRWIKEKKKEYYYRKAKKEDYRSRASYKLKQLNRKFSIIEKGDNVLELGAAPGGWSQVALEMVGGKGFVVGIDLQRIEPFYAPNIKTIKGDFTQEEILLKVTEIFPKYDVLISDASPDISGVWDIDHFCSVELCRYALKLAHRFLKVDGNFLVKVFQGREVDDFVEEVRDHFTFVKMSKPRASRDQSAEIYVIAKGFLQAPFKRGDIIEIEIADIGKQGDGFGHYLGYKVFIKGTNKGEKIKAKVKKIHPRFATGEKIDTI